MDRHADSNRSYNGKLMTRHFLKLSPFTAVLLLMLSCAQPNRPKSDFAVTPIDLKDVQVTDAFWTPRLENNRTVSILTLWDKFDQMGRNPDLRLIEAACYELAKKPDAALRSRIDGQLDAIIAHIRSRKHKWSSKGDGELLYAGNFLEASVAYYEATGSRKLLDVAIEIADDLDSTFGPDKRHDISNHEGIKLGLVRLYRCTGNEKYLKLARFFLDSRGNSAGRTVMYGPYAQDQESVKSQTRAVGHCVRATYLYIPLTDIAALTDDPEYAQADERIWEDAVSKRMFLTGGFGSYRHEENFGDDYDLPNVACWNEICAAYGTTLWNDKLFLLRQDAKYADVMERTLYNALLVGVSEAGDTYLYQAPLKTYSGFARQRWFGPNCCPPNLARLLPQLGRLIYAQNDKSIYINLFVGSRANLKLGDTGVGIVQETRYPWDGAVNLTLNPSAPTKFTLFLRIPGWAEDLPVPSQLYSYLPAPHPAYSLTLNGTPLTVAVEKGYARIEREWKSGDSVQLNLPMPVRRVLANESVADDRGMVALERGPIVYCVERADNPEGVFNLLIPDNAELQFAYRGDVLGGVGEIVGNAIALSRGTDRVSLVRKQRKFTAIPYYAFGNRGSGEMAVWLARDESKTVVPPPPTVASTARASSSVGNGTVAEEYPGHHPPTFEERLYPNSQDGSGEISAVYNQVEPVNSEDGSSRFLRIHPQSGDRAWVQYDFVKPTKVSSVEVYWKDDKQYCVLPQAWRLLYKAGSDWKPVETSDPYGVAKDRFNKVAFRPVTTSGLRLEIRLQGRTYRTGDLGPPDANYLQQDLTWYEGGVIQWRVNP
jgi:hypothetical protein